MCFRPGSKREKQKLIKLLDAAEAVGESGDFYRAMADYKAAIDMLEDHDIDGDRLYYAQQYIEHGDLDEAWDYLAYLAVRRPKLRPKIRKEQVRILTLRRDWVEAMRYVLYRNVERAKYHGPYLSRPTFLRELEPIADELGLSEEEREHFADLVEEQTKCPPYRVDVVDAAYNIFVADKGLR